MTVTDIELVDLTEIVGDLDIICDYDDEDDPHDDPAQWVLTLTRCPCGAGGQTLACDRCKRARLEESFASVECGHCGEVTSPARLAYSHVEPLDRRAK